MTGHSRVQLSLSRRTERAAEIEPSFYWALALNICREPNLRRSKYQSSPSPKTLPVYEVLHKVHAIKIRFHYCNDKIVFFSD